MTRDEMLGRIAALEAQLAAMPQPEPMAEPVPPVPTVPPIPLSGDDQLADVATQLGTGPVQVGPIFDDCSPLDQALADLDAANRHEQWLAQQGKHDHQEPFKQAMRAMGRLFH